jgi:RNA:NAD 2'-phosphotransferase (TPT1/KptA family)
MYQIIFSKKMASNTYNDKIRASKWLSYVLRHGADKERLDMDESGFISIKSILQHPKMKKYDTDYIMDIVKSDNKKRFYIEEMDGELYIRASQGHSIEKVKADIFMTQLNITNINEYPIIVHGTYKKVLDLILESGGLCRMDRNHIHFATGLPDKKEVISGMRTNCDVLIYIDLENALKDGIPFYKSENGVILSPGIGPTGILPKKYFSKIVKR